MEKGVPNIASPTKPIEISTMTWEEREEIFHQLSKLENQFNEFFVKSITSNDMMEKKMDENRDHIEKNTDENRDQMEKNMHGNRVPMEKKMDENMVQMEMKMDKKDGRIEIFHVKHLVMYLR
jgi:hypothetical protein